MANMEREINMEFSKEEGRTHIELSKGTQDDRNVYSFDKTYNSSGKYEKCIQLTVEDMEWLLSHNSTKELDKDLTKYKERYIPVTKPNTPNTSKKLTEREKIDKEHQEKIAKLEAKEKPQPSKKDKKELSRNGQLQK